MQSFKDFIRTIIDESLGHKGSSMCPTCHSYDVVHEEMENGEFFNICRKCSKRWETDQVNEAANTKAVLIAVPKDPHDPHSDKRGYWKIGDEVYRASVDGATDVHGHPTDKRWEASFDHFARYWHSSYERFYTKTKNWK